MRVDPTRYNCADFVRIQSCPRGIPSPTNAGNGARGGIMASELALGHAGVLKPGPLRWLRALAWLFALAIVCILAMNLAAEAAYRVAPLISGEPFTTRADAPVLVRLAAIIVGSITLLIVYALAIGLAERRKPTELSLKHAAPDLIVGLLIGGILIALIVGALWAAGWVTITPTPITRVAESIKQAIQSGVAEEILIRLIVFRLLWRATALWPAFIITALLFGGLHLANPDATLFSALCLAAGEGIGAGLYLLTGRIWMSIGMHAGWNFAQGWLFGAAVSGLDTFPGGPLQTQPVTGVNEMLSGGGFGPEIVDRVPGHIVGRERDLSIPCLATRPHTAAALAICCAR